MFSGQGVHELRQYLNAKAQASVDLPLQYMPHSDEGDESATAEQEEDIDHGWAVSANPNGI